MAMRVAETRGSEGRPVMGRIEVAFLICGAHYLAGNGADFSLVLERETSCGTDEGSKANDGGANRWCSFPHCRGSFRGSVNRPPLSIA